MNLFKFALVLISSLLLTSFAQAKTLKSCDLELLLPMEELFIDIYKIEITEKNGKLYGKMTSPSGDSNFGTESVDYSESDITSDSYFFEFFDDLKSSLEEFNYSGPEVDRYLNTLEKVKPSAKHIKAYKSAMHDWGSVFIYIEFFNDSGDLLARSALVGGAPGFCLEKN